MRFLLPLFLLLLIVAANPAFAQDSALPGTTAPEPSIDEQLGLSRPEEKRKSTGNLKRDYALQYYDECMKREHPAIPPSARNLLCGCTSQEIETNMPYNDIVAMFNDPQKAPKIHQELLRTSYADCARHPASDIVKNDCMKMTTLNKVGKKRHNQVCQCTSETIARFLTVKAREIIMMELESAPKDIDPLGSYLSSRAFQASYRSYLDRCIDLHVFGYR